MSLSMNEYQKGASRTARYPGAGGTNGLVYTTLGLAGEAGELANKVKKVLRDNDGNLNGPMRLALAEELGDCLWYVAMLASELEFTLDDIAEANLDKLASRAERGVIKGSGDQR